MAAGDSPVTVCNLALSELGEDPIVSLFPPDNSRRARLCALHYDQVRRAELRRYPWNCAEWRAQIPASATPPPFGYANAFPLPADFIRFWNSPDSQNDEWSIESGQVLTDDDAPLNIIYIRDLQDCTVMTADLIMVLALKLALVLCAPLSQSGEKLNEIKLKLADIQPEAQLVDSQENSPREWDDDIWLRSRA